MTRPAELLTRLRRRNQFKFLNNVINEIVQLRAAAKASQAAADRWQARAEKAERELHSQRKNSTR